MELTILTDSPSTVRAGYSCPCGCTPSVAFERGATVVRDDCCCGNHFAVGPKASSSLTPRSSFRLEAQGFETPWGEALEAAWLVGPSVHGPASEHDHHDDEHAHDAEQESSARQQATILDPVCGMTVEPESARARGLHSSYQGRDFFFCGKGCKLDFDEDPDRYLDPGYVPSM